MAKSSYRVPFSGRAHHYSEAEIETVTEIMQQANPLTQGHYLRQFEADFCRYTGAAHSLGVCNATAALELSAQMCQFEPGDEVIIPAHTYTSSAYPFIKAGAKPVWADIDLTTRVMTVDTIRPLITQRTRAIVVVHLYGYGVDMKPICELAQENGIIVIEDAAQALGVRVDGRHVGTFGDFGVFSFHSHKNMSTLGEGGMLTTKKKLYDSTARLLRHNGHEPFAPDREHYWIPCMGNVVLPKLRDKAIMPSNYCMGEVEAGLGSMMLQRIDEMNQQKRVRAMAFIDGLSDLVDLEFHRVDDERHNYHLLAARCLKPFRDCLIEGLSENKGIQCVVQYYPLNRYDLYRDLGYGAADCPNTDTFFDNMVSFPFHHWLAEGDLNYIVDSVRAVATSL
jgi:perosamine synthetase